jgi:hypothetical protein
MFSGTMVNWIISILRGVKSITFLKVTFIIGEKNNEYENIYANPVFDVIDFVVLV